MRGESGHQGDSAEVYCLLRWSYKQTLIAGGDLRAGGIVKARLDIVVAAFESREIVLEGRLPFQIALVGDFGVGKARLGRSDRIAVAARQHQRDLLELQRMLARLSDELLMLPRQR